MAAIMNHLQQLLYLHSSNSSLNQVSTYPQPSSLQHWNSTINTNKNVPNFGPVFLIDLVLSSFLSIMSSVDVELIPPALSLSSSYISRASSAASVLVSRSPEPPDVAQGDNADGPLQDVELAGNIDGIDVDGVAALSKLDGMCVVGLQNGTESRPWSKGMIWNANEVD